MRLTVRRLWSMLKNAADRAKAVPPSLQATDSALWDRPFGLSGAPQAPFFSSLLWPVLWRVSATFSPPPAAATALKPSLCALALCAMLACCACGGGKPSLGLLVWEGYADPSFIRGFEQKCNCRVNASYMGSSDELVAKLRGGSASNYDVISPSSDVATMIVTSGLAAPLDLSKIPSYNQLMTSLTSLPLVKSQGRVYGVPFQWGPNPLLYDTTAFKTAPDSWTVLWSPDLRGKVSVWDDLSTVYMAAQVLGYDRPDPGALYNLTDEQLSRVK